MTPQLMDAVSQQFGERLQHVDAVSYLCELNEKGCKVYLWKITFKVGGDDVVVRLAVQSQKVAGFFFE